MKKQDTVMLSVVIFIITAIIITTPILLPVLAGNTSSFNVTLSVNAGTPVITTVAAISDSPTEGAVHIINFYFNATHPNGVSYIPATGAVVTLNKSGQSNMVSTGCSIYSTSGTRNEFECNISLPYTAVSGVWTINASIVDTLTVRVSDLSKTYTNGITYGVRLTQPTLAFTGSPGDINRSAAQNPQVVNNTGNFAYSQINLTAFNLASGSNIIGATNFTANTTANSDGYGQILSNNTMVQLADSAVAIGATKNVYVYLDIPNGVANGTYTNVNPWVVTLS